jgi:sugar lactone lactonase YvrE
MKKHFIPLIAVLLIAVIGCKKTTQQSEPSTQPPVQPPTVPPPDKKWVVTTIAGDGTRGYLEGPALSAKFNAPSDVAIAPDGTLYVADFRNHRIRKIAAGEVSTLAGNNSFGIVNDNGALAQFGNPYRIALDPAGNVYVIDEADIRIRKINTTANVSFFAGTNRAGFLDGPVLTAQFQWNEGGIVADIQGNMYISDQLNNRIRKVSIAGQVSTVAGNGTGGFQDGDAETAQFNFPDGIAFDTQGNLFIAELANYCIRKITPNGIVSRFAGNGIFGIADGAAGIAQFNSPGDMVADADGNLFVIDNNRIRKITPQGVVSTIAGGEEGYADGDGASAKFSGLSGLGIDAQGNLYAADINNNRIRKISLQ